MNGRLRHIVELIVEHVDPQRVILFGSRSGPRSDSSSDYDLCVLKPEVAKRRALAQRIYRLLVGHGVAVDVIVETPDRFETLKTNPFLVHYDIARHGKVLYEKR